MINQYIIDENLPADISLWSGVNFIYASTLIHASDSDIWKLAIDLNAVIVTKDTDFYHRYLSGSKRAKVLWFRTGNMKKAAFNEFVNNVWPTVVEMLASHDFIIINLERIEAYS